MHVFISFLLLVAIVLLLLFVSRHAKRLEFKKHSPQWIALIWAVSIGMTLLFRHYYELPIVVYILFSTGIATITYLVMVNVDISASLLFSLGNTVALLMVMFYFGMLGNRTEINVTSGDVQLVADNVCQCGANQMCLDEALPKMNKLMLESQLLAGNEAIVAANAIARAHHCMTDNPVKPEYENIVTFLDDWEKETNDNISVTSQPPLLKNKIDNESDHVISQASSRISDKKLEKNTKSTQAGTAALFQKITINALNKHQGDLLRLTKSNGKVLNGWLVADEGSKIILKQKLSGGYVQMPIAKTSISLLEVKPSDGSQ